MDLTIDLLLVVLALVFAILSMVDEKHPWLPVAVILLAISLII